MTSRDPQKCRDAVRSAILATARLLVRILRLHHIRHHMSDGNSSIPLPLRFMLLVDLVHHSHIITKCINPNAYFAFLTHDALQTAERGYMP